MQNILKYANNYLHSFMDKPTLIVITAYAAICMYVVCTGIALYYHPFITAAIFAVCAVCVGVYMWRWCR